MKPSALRTIGKIVASHGLQGEVSIKPWDDDPRWVGELTHVFVYKNKGPVEMEIEWARVQNTVVILKFKTVTNRDEAEMLKGFDIKATEAQLPELQDDEYYADTLIGHTVKSQDSGQLLGTIQDILGSDAGDFLEIVSEDLAEPILVPFQDSFVPQVDMDQKTVFIAGLDSLFKDT